MWTLVEPETNLTPSPRDSHILVNSGNSIFLFGGSTGNPRSDFYEFKIDESKWVAVNHKGGKPPTSRFCHVGFVLKKKFYIFGGYDGDSRLNDFHYFLIDDRTLDIPASTLLSDLENLVGNRVSLVWLTLQSFSDVTFILEGSKEFPAHKMLLARCPYFAAMFSMEMREKTLDKIKLENISH